ncbi:MAG: tetratricopeptide repeat protein [Patescibacteria group bacterium]
MTNIQPLAQRLFSALAGTFRKAPIVHTALFVLAVLMPLAYVPGSAELFSPLKHVLLVVAVAFGLFGWSAHVYRQREWTLRRSIAMWLPAFVLLGVVISAALAPSGYSAWVGTGPLGFTSVVPMFAFVGLYALVVNTGDYRSALRMLSYGLLLGGALTGALSVLALFGIIPAAVAPMALSPTGTPESLTILLSTLSVFALGIWIVDDHDDTDVWLPTTVWRKAHWPVWIVLWLSTLVWLLVTDTLLTQIVLLVGSGALLALGLYQPSRFVKPLRMLALMAVFGLGLVLLLVPSPFTGRVSSEIGLNLRAATHITTATLQNEGWLFGSGPGSYLYDYLRYRPEEIVRTSFWALPFDHSFSYLLDVAATWGLVPTVLYAAFILWTLWRLVHALLVKRVREHWQTLAVLGSVWLMAVVAQLVYASDAVLMTLFWMLAGLVVAHAVLHTRAIPFKSNARVALASSGLFVATGIVTVLCVSVMVQWFGASLFVDGARRHGDEPYAVDRLLLRAIRLNPWSADYRRMHAFSHLRIADQLAGEASPPELVQQRVQFAIDDVSRAVALEPRDVLNHEARRAIFASLGRVVAGADKAAADSALQAASLDPHNPVRWQRVAESYLIMATNAESVIQNASEREATALGLLAEAEAAVERAIEKKPNYAPSYYTRSLVYKQQGRLDEAIAQLSALVVNTPGDAVLRFELGVLHLQKGSFEKARMDFEAAVALQPTFANAKWYLASVYEFEGRTDEALVQLEDLRVLDPENRDVQARIELMRNGILVPPDKTEPLEEPANTFD